MTIRTRPVDVRLCSDNHGEERCSEPSQTLAV
jgi:hypothetical protein